MINDYLGILKNASAHGLEIDRMLEIVHWFMFALFIGWSTFFIYALIRFRKGKNPKADYTGVTGHTSHYIEISVVVIEAILLLGFAFPLWAKRVNQFPSEKNAVVVHVLGEQFAWNFHYPGPDGKFGKQDLKLVSSDNPVGLDHNDPNGKDDIITINQLHLPVGKPAIIYVSSKDVIHSFTLRNMRITQDAIPGMSVPVWFTPIQTGNYEIACAQLCGMGHYRMRGFLTVDSQEDYDKWLKEQAAANSSSGGSNSYE